MTRIPEISKFNEAFHDPWACRCLAIENTVQSLPKATLNDSDAVKALAALAQGHRLAVFRLLVVAGPDGLSVGHIAEALGLANATLSFHLKELANAGLIASRQEGRFVFYSASIDRMNALIAFLTENCCQGVPGLCEPSSPRKC